LIREVPLPPWNATKKIQTKRLKLRKGVNCEVRLRQQAKARDPTSLRELMPLRLANRTKIQIRDDLFEQPLQDRKIAQQRRSAPVSLNDPLDAIHVDFVDYGWA
jgi:hypothetical protein